jgi:methyl-accepting chemotaxis protein
MNENAKGMQRLTNISKDVEQKINDTSSEMQHSIEVAVKSVEDSQIMVKHTDEIINQIVQINAHSSSNKEKVISIENDSKNLLEVAHLLDSRINEFKS